MKRAVIVVIILFCILPFSFAAMTGYCTGQYLEQGPNWIDGLVQQGDVFEYWCELPEPVGKDSVLEIKLQYSNAEIIQAVLTPRAIFGTSVVVYP